MELLDDFWSLTMVDVDEERLKVFAMGARCVSLSLFVTAFHDMVASLCLCDAGVVLVWWMSRRWRGWMSGKRGGAVEAGEGVLEERRGAE